MSNYRRSREGHTYFFTVVTNERRGILTTDLGRTCLRNAIRTVQHELPFHNVAFVLLPDHLHAVWELPHGDTDYSTRWRRIKSLFTRSWIAAGGSKGTISESRQTRREQGIWQHSQTIISKTQASGFALDRIVESLQPRIDGFANIRRT